MSIWFICGAVNVAFLLALIWLDAKDAMDFIVEAEDVVVGEVALLVFLLAGAYVLGPIATAVIATLGFDVWFNDGKLVERPVFKRTKM